jgi:nucleoside phosphorylase
MLAICAAMGWEIRPILHAIGPIKRSKHGPVCLWKSTSRGDSIVVFRTGIGCAAAVETTRAVLAALPIRTVINTGCAGALVGDLAVGSIVIPRTLLDDSNVSRTADEACVRRLRAAALRARLSGNDGPLLTSRSVLSSGMEKRLARERFGATAVEMEGYAVAEVARQHSVRFGSARAILDSSELDLPAGSVLRLALRTVTSPLQLPAMVSLANAVKAVQTSLQLLFRCFLEESSSD